MIAALTARGSAIFSAAKKNGSSEFQITSRAIAASLGAGDARHVDQPAVDVADAGEHRDEHRIEHQQPDQPELRRVVDAEPEDEQRHQRVFRNADRRHDVGLDRGGEPRQAAQHERQRDAGRAADGKADRRQPQASRRRARISAPDQRVGDDALRTP